MNNKVIILTDEIQTGKTTLLKQFCIKQNNVAGMLTPVVNGKRMFYDITGKELFAMESIFDEECLPVGKYLFSATAFAKANALLLSQSKRDDISYLIIDEIGPLEVKQQKGWYESFRQILSSSFAYTLIIVVRKALVNEVITGFGLKSFPVLNIAQMIERFELPCILPEK
jgi:nucleoside-triphosphatase THEP1